MHKKDVKECRKKSATVMICMVSIAVFLLSITCISDMWKTVMKVKEEKVVVKQCEKVDAKILHMDNGYVSVEDTDHNYNGIYYADITVSYVVKGKAYTGRLKEYPIFSKNYQTKKKAEKQTEKDAANNIQTIKIYVGEKQTIYGTVRTVKEDIKAKHEHMICAMIVFVIYIFIMTKPENP